MWKLSDKCPSGAASIDTINDFNLTEKDALDLRELLQGESSASGNLLNYLEIEIKGGITDISISSSGDFSSSNYNTSTEDARVVLTDIDLFSTTDLGTEADLIAN